MHSDLQSWFVLAMALGTSGIASLIWFLGDPDSRLQRWAARISNELAEARLIAQRRREAEAVEDAESVRDRLMAAHELERLSRVLSRRDN